MGQKIIQISEQRRYFGAEHACTLGFFLVTQTDKER